MIDIGNCYNCEKEVDANIIYCDDCYQSLCKERINLVNKYLKNGCSFTEACEIVAEKYDVDMIDVELLFD